MKAPTYVHTALSATSREPNIWPAQPAADRNTHPPLVRDDGQLVAMSLVSDRKLSAFDQPPNHPYGCFFNVETETHEREHAAHLSERQRQEHHAIKLS